MGKIWIVVTGKGEAATLLSLLKCDAGEVSALVLGSREIAEEAARGTAGVSWIDTDGVPAECFASAAEGVLEDASPDIMLGVATPGTRAVLGAAAEKMGACIASNVISASIDGDTVKYDRMAIGDKLVRSISAPAPAALLANPLSVSAGVLYESDAIATIDAVEATPSDAVSIASSGPAPVSDVENAEYVVGIGRGVKDEQMLAKTKELAEVMGAKMSCTMPIHTETDYLPVESYYIGLSGLKIAPKLYIALGISGTSQHLAGIRNAKEVVVVNKDPKAKFFDNADYGIVGDLEDVVPELIKALG